MLVYIIFSLGIISTTYAVVEMTKFSARACVCVGVCVRVCHEGSQTVVFVANICRIIEWNAQIRDEIFVDLLVLLVY